MSWARGLVTVLGLVLGWQILVTVTSAQPYILPSPWRVAAALWSRADLILPHAWITSVEILLGLGLGTCLGMVTALLLASSASARRWLLPVLLVSQAIPVFALAPILVLWLGYGLASKVAMAVLIIYFPVTVALQDGLRRTPPGWIELARSMDAGPLATLMRVRLPAALPAFASGLRVATSVAPIGAVVGEWVGSSGGLGYLMLHANGRMQTDLMFAALIALCVIAVTLWLTVDRLLGRLIYWHAEADAPS